jgi:hypothetical protein
MTWHLTWHAQSRRSPLIDGCGSCMGYVGSRSWSVDSNSDSETLRMAARLRWEFGALSSIQAPDQFESKSKSTLAPPRAAALNLQLIKLKSSCSLTFFFPLSCCDACIESHSFFLALISSTSCSYNVMSS